MNDRELRCRELLKEGRNGEFRMKGGSLKEKGGEGGWYVVED